MTIEKDDMVQHTELKGPDMLVVAIDKMAQTAICEWFNNHNTQQRATFELGHLKRCQPRKVSVIGSF